MGSEMQVSDDGAVEVGKALVKNSTVLKVNLSGKLPCPPQPPRPKVLDPVLCSLSSHHASSMALPAEH